MKRFSSALSSSLIAAGGKCRRDAMRLCPSSTPLAVAAAMTTASPATTTAARCFSSAAPSRSSEGQGVTEDQQDHVRRLASTIQNNVKEGEQSLKDDFGGEHAEKRWLVDFYKHKEHRYFVPACAIFLGDEAVTNMPSVASKTAFFFASALKSIPSDRLSSYVNTLPFVCDDQGLLLAILRHAGNGLGIGPARELYEKMATSIRRKAAGTSDGRGLIEAGQHVGSVPLLPAETWPLPFENAELSKSWQTITQPFELSPSWRPAKDILTFQQYCLLGSTTILECLWAGFYATGDKKFLYRVIEIASFWSEVASEAGPDQVQYLTSIQTPLPSSLTAESSSVEYQQRAAKAQASRAACWSLLSNARRHEAVTQALCEAISALSPHMLSEPKEEDAASKVEEATVVVDGEEEAAAEAKKAEEAAATRAALLSKLSPAQVKRRLEVLPGLLHLLGRMVLDSSGSAGAAAKSN